MPAFKGTHDPDFSLSRYAWQTKSVKVSVYRAISSPPMLTQEFGDFAAVVAPGGMGQRVRPSLSLGVDVGRSGEQGTSAASARPVAAAK